MELAEAAHAAYPKADGLEIRAAKITIVGAIAYDPGNPDHRRFLAGLKLGTIGLAQVTYEVGGLGVKHCTDSEGEESWAQMSRALRIHSFGVRCGRRRKATVRPAG